MPIQYWNTCGKKAQWAKLNEKSAIWSKLVDYIQIWNLESQKFHSGPENLKNSRPKKFVKINFMKKNFGQILFFAISKMAKLFHFLQFLKWS